MASGAVKSIEKASDKLPKLFVIIPCRNEGNFIGNLHLFNPAGYLAISILEQNGLLILTDSGGVQKGAYFFGVPCITLRPKPKGLRLLRQGECGRR